MKIVDQRGCRITLKEMPIGDWFECSQGTFIVGRFGNTKGTQYKRLCISSEGVDYWLDVNIHVTPLDAELVIR